MIYLGDGKKYIYIYILYDPLITLKYKHIIGKVWTKNINCDYLWVRDDLFKIIPYSDISKLYFTCVTFATIHNSAIS